MTDYASLRFFLLNGAEAAAFLVVAAYSLMALRRGPWAKLGALGGVIGGLAASTLAVGWAVVEFSEDFGVFDFINDHDPLGDLLDFGRPMAIALLASGFMLGRASRSNAVSQ